MFDQILVTLSLYGYKDRPKHNHNSEIIKKFTAIPKERRVGKGISKILKEAIIKDLYLLPSKYAKRSIISINFINSLLEVI